MRDSKAGRVTKISAGIKPSPDPGLPTGLTRRCSDVASTPDPARFPPRCSSFSSRCLQRRAADAQSRRRRDLVQDTFVKALRFSGRFERGTNLKAWLYTILHNTWRNRRRDAAAIRSTWTASGSSELRARPGGTGEFETPERMLLRATLGRELQAALDAICPTRSARPCGYGTSRNSRYAEIAGMLTFPIGTVMSRISRGRRLLFERAVARTAALVAAEVTGSRRWNVNCRHESVTVSHDRRLTPGRIVVRGRACRRRATSDACPPCRRIAEPGMRRRGSFFAMCRAPSRRTAAARPRVTRSWPWRRARVAASWSGFAVSSRLLSSFRRCWSSFSWSSPSSALFALATRHSDALLAAQLTADHSNASVLFRRRRRLDATLRRSSRMLAVAIRPGCARARLVREAGSSSLARGGVSTPTAGFRT